MEALNYEQIIKGLKENFRQSIELEIHQQLSSTNTYLSEKALTSDTNICFAQFHELRKIHHKHFTCSKRCIR